MLHEGWKGCAAAWVSAMALALATMPAGAAQHGSVKAATIAAEASPGVREMARWAAASGDNAGLPFAIVDKVQGTLFVFDPDGRLRASSAALVGAARGDANIPGIGERQISSIRPEEKITPAGRFVTKMGLTTKGEDILWVDYDSALALHRVVTSVPQERRLQRLASPVAQDRRITYGCINVPADFYDLVVKPTFAAGGVVYILPEQVPPQAVFGTLVVKDTP